MANKRYANIDDEMKSMKPGELRHVRTGPGREGLMTVKKGDPKPEPTIIEDLDKRKKAKVIQGIRAVAPAGYN